MRTTIKCNAIVSKRFDATSEIFVFQPSLITRVKFFNIDIFYRDNFTVYIDNIFMLFKIGS